jgi:hypothetical protein
VCVSPALAVASEGVDSGICLYPRSFETSSFTVEVTNSFVEDSSVAALGFVIEGESPIDIGMVVEILCSKD